MDLVLKNRFGFQSDALALEFYLGFDSGQVISTFYFLLQTSLL